MDEMELSAKLEGLKKEIPYKFRVQSSNAYGFTCVAYIDARDVMDLLDEAVGSHCWQTKYDEHKGNLYCSIGIKIGEEWVWKTDCGTESNMDKEKGEASDALKRAAVQWGIGRFLYSLDIPKFGKDYVRDNGRGKFVPYSAKLGRNMNAKEINQMCLAMQKKS